MLYPLDVLERHEFGQQLQRLNIEKRHIGYGSDIETLDVLQGAVAADRAGLERPDNVTTEDLHRGLRLLVNLREDLDAAEIRFIEGALDRGQSLTALAKDVYGYSRPALTKRYYNILGGTRSPLVGNPEAVTPPGIVVRYWMALTEADVTGQEAVEVQLRRFGNDYKPVVPLKFSRGESASWFGELPRPGKVMKSTIYPSGDSTRPIEVWVRAEAAPATEEQGR